jgi:hypothetical protein
MALQNIAAKSPIREGEKLLHSKKSNEIPTFQEKMISVRAKGLTTATAYRDHFFGRNGRLHTEPDGLPSATTEL